MTISDEDVRILLIIQERWRKFSEYYDRIIQEKRDATR